MNPHVGTQHAVLIMLIFQSYCCFLVGIYRKIYLGSGKATIFRLWALTTICNHL